MISPTFAVPIGRYNINRQLTKDELMLLNNLDMEQNQENYVSVDSYVLDKLENLKKDIEVILKEYTDECLDLPEDAEIYITQSWVNHTSKGESHHKHYHWNSIYSGSFYIDVDPLRDAIELWSGHKPLFDFYKPEHFSTWFPCEVGAVFLFPSNIDHSVRVIANGMTRKSLAFNTFVRGDIGSINGLTKITL